MLFWNISVYTVRPLLTEPSPDRIKVQFRGVSSLEGFKEMVVYFFRNCIFNLSYLKYSGILHVLTQSFQSKQLNNNEDRRRHFNLSYVFATSEVWVHLYVSYS